MNKTSHTVISFYERNAQNWDNERNRQLFEKAWLDRFLKFIPEGGSILDVGCGSGQPIAEYLIGRGYKVTGIDSSPRLIQMCKSRFPDQEWMVEDMREMKRRKLFDGILAWDSVFHLIHDDQKLMFRVFNSHAKPGAPLMFTAGPEHGEAIKVLWDAPLYHASFAEDEYYDLLLENGFCEISHRLQDQECGSRSVFLAKRNPS